MTEPRNILHLISHLDGYGTAGQLRKLAREQLANGCRPTIVALRANRQVLAAWARAGLRCRVLQRRWRFDPFAAWRLSEQLLRDRPEVIHAWDVGAVNFAAVARLRAQLRVTRVARVPLVATLLMAPPTTYWLSGQVDRLAVGSEKLSREYSERAVAAEKLVVAPPAVCPASETASETAPTREQMLAGLGLPADAQVIALAGPLTRAKRIDEAIWCFALVRALNEQAVLLILGDGPERQRLERFARLVSDPATVKFLGYRDNLRPWLSGADVFWQPGEQKTISIAALESMAERVPVVASDLPASRELIEHGRTGLLAPLGSRAGLARHTLRLLENADLASEIGGAAAEEVSKRYSSAAMIDAYRDLYRHLPGSVEPLE